MAHALSRSVVGTGEGARQPLQHRRRPAHGARYRRGAARQLVRLSFGELGSQRAGRQRTGVRHRLQARRLHVRADRQCQRRALRRRRRRRARGHLRQARPRSFWRNPARWRGRFSTPRLRSSSMANIARGAPRVSPPTRLPALVQKLDGINRDKLLATIADYNRAVPAAPAVRRQQEGRPRRRPDSPCRSRTGRRPSTRRRSRPMR